MNRPLMLPVQPALVRHNTCKTCGHCQLNPQALRGQAPGECHFNPPTVAAFPMQQPDGHMGFVTNSLFAPIQLDWWCNQWKPKIEGMH